MARRIGNFPRSLSPCQFCKGKEIKLNSDLIRTDAGDLSAIFTLECLICGYTTDETEYVDMCCHLWNMAKKLEVAKLIDSTTVKKHD